MYMKEASTASCTMYELTVRLPVLPANRCKGLAGRGLCEKLCCAL